MASSLSPSVTEPRNLRYEEITVGTVVQFTRQLTAQDCEIFARLTGDSNPLHRDSEYAKAQNFSGPLVHGLLAAGFFSTLVGMYCPGRHSLYLGQSLEFRQPLFAGDQITVRGTVTEKHDSIRVIKLHTEIQCERGCAVQGVATVKMLPPV